MSNTPKTDAAARHIDGFADQWVPRYISEEIEREMIEPRKATTTQEELDKWEQLAYDKLSEVCKQIEKTRIVTEQRDQLKRECDAWKAAHDNQVKLKQIISDRPDLKERAKLVAELIEERDGWREAAYSLAEAIPPSWEELQPPAAQLQKFKEMVALQNEKTKKELNL